LQLLEQSDVELISLWQQGNDSAFESIYRRYARQLLVIAMRKTGDREISEDIIQDVFLSLYDNKRNAHNLNSLPAYLYVILKNEILTHYRRSLVSKKYEDRLVLSYREQDDTTQDLIETKQLEQLLIEEIEKLPPQCKTVFKLSRHQHLKNKEIATRLNISENTVEQHMRKAIRILRGALLHYGKSFILIGILFKK